MKALTRLLEELQRDRRSKVARLAAAALQELDGEEIVELARELTDTPAGHRLRKALMEAYNEGP